MARGGRQAGTRSSQRQTATSSGSQARLTSSQQEMLEPVIKRKHAKISTIMSVSEPSEGGPDDLAPVRPVKPSKRSAPEQTPAPPIDIADDEESDLSELDESPQPATSVSFTSLLTALLILISYIQKRKKVASNSFQSLLTPTSTARKPKSARDIDDRVHREALAEALGQAEPQSQVERSQRSQRSSQVDRPSQATTQAMTQVMTQAMTQMQASYDSGGVQRPRRQLPEYPSDSMDLETSLLALKRPHMQASNKGKGGPQQQPEDPFDDMDMETQDTTHRRQQPPMPSPFGTQTQQHPVTLQRDPVTGNVLPPSHGGTPTQTQQRLDSYIPSPIQGQRRIQFADDLENSMTRRREWESREPPNIPRADRRNLKASMTPLPNSQRHGYERRQPEASMTPGMDYEHPDPIGIRRERELDNTVHEWSRSEQVAMMELEVYSRQVYLAGLNNDNWALPARRAFPSAAPTNEVFLKATRKVRRDYKNWKSAVLHNTYQHVKWFVKDHTDQRVGKMVSFKQLFDRINKDFEMHWIPVIFSFAAKTIDFENLTKLGGDFLRYELKASFIHSFITVKAC